MRRGAQGPTESIFETQCGVPLQITCDQRAGRLEPLSSRISTSLSSASPRAGQTDLLTGLRRALDPASTAARLDPLDVRAQ